MDFLRNLSTVLVVAWAGLAPLGAQPAGDAWLTPGNTVLVSPMGLKDDFHPAKVIRYNADSETYLVRFVSGPYAIGKGEYTLSKSRMRPQEAAAAPVQSAPAAQSVPPAQAPATQPPTTQPPTTTAADRPKSEAWAAMQKDIDERIAASKNPPKNNAGPVGGAAPFAGIYLRHEQSFSGTSLNYREDHYYFFSDGRVYHGVPPEGPSHFDWAKAQAKNPELCGRYGVSGNQITFSWPSGSYTWMLKGSGSAFDMNYSPTVKVEKFPANARLSGTYERGSVHSAPGVPNLSTATGYTFSPDGSVTYAGMGGTDSTNATTTVREQQRGTYTLSGNDLELRLGGAVWRCTAFPQWEGAPSQTPKRLSVDGTLLERKR